MTASFVLQIKWKRKIQTIEKQEMSICIMFQRYKAKLFQMENLKESNIFTGKQL